jgi:hypothetical protein
VQFSKMGIIKQKRKSEDNQKSVVCLRQKGKKFMVKNLLKNPVDRFVKEGIEWNKI